MKRKQIIITILIVLGLVVWNIGELPDFKPDKDKIQALSVSDTMATVLDWDWFDLVDIKITGTESRLLSLPDTLEYLDGKEVTVSAASFACGDDIVETVDGFTINGFILVPYFTMIDCCLGNPTQYFQWTIVVEELKTPWEIHHKGIIDPEVIVKGKLRIKREATRDGVFFLDDAEVVYTAEEAAANSKSQ